MQYSEKGQIAYECWRAIPDHFPTVELGVFMVMPNHVHGIIILHEDADRDAASAYENRSAISSTGYATLSPTVGAHHPQDTLRYDAPLQDAPQQNTRERVAPLRVQPGSLGSIIRQYKSSVTRKIVQQYGVVPNIWQRNYYEHIIRNDEEHKRIHLYIESNPIHWISDDENPEMTS